MDDLKELLETLRALGVKSASFREEGVLAAVELFPSIAPLDLDALAPQAKEDAPAENIPAAIARILKNGSVS